MPFRFFPCVEKGERAKNGISTSVPDPGRFVRNPDPTSVPLDDGSGSCSFFKWLQDAKKSIFSEFFCLLLTVSTFASIVKDNKSLKIQIQIKVFFFFFLVLMEGSGSVQLITDVDPDLCNLTAIVLTVQCVPS